MIRGWNIDAMRAATRVVMKNTAIVYLLSKPGVYDVPPVSREILNGFVIAGSLLAVCLVAATAIGGRFMYIVSRLWEAGVWAITVPVSALAARQLFNQGVATLADVLLYATPLFCAKNMLDMQAPHAQAS